MVQRNVSEGGAGLVPCSARCSAPFNMFPPPPPLSRHTRLHLLQALSAPAATGCGRSRGTGRRTRRRATSNRAIRHPAALAAATRNALSATPVRTRDKNLVGREWVVDLWCAARFIASSAGYWSLSLSLPSTPLSSPPSPLSAPTSSGTYCGKCDEGFFLDAESCRACSSPGGYIAILLANGVFFVAFVLAAITFSGP